MLLSAVAAGTYYKNKVEFVPITTIYVALFREAVMYISVFTIQFSTLLSGLCMTMCSEDEMSEREKVQILHPLEVDYTKYQTRMRGSFVR